MKANINFSGNKLEIPSKPKQKFTKPPLTIDEQIALLESRGLKFGDKNTAKEQLNRNFYYRLSGYMVHFYDRATETFFPGTKFKDITELYYFDGDLKLLLLEALELIEVDFKTKLINTLSLKYKNPHWFMDSQIFLSDSDFDLASEIIAKGIEKNRENIFIKHYEDKYNDPALPPSRMVFEILAFGETSRVFQALNSRDKKLIAKEYELFFPQLESWIACLAYLRNLSAHSDRVWNRRMTKIVKVKGFEKYFGCENKSLFAYLVVICYLLRIVASGSAWFGKIEKLIDSHKSIPLMKMGFPKNWREIIREKVFVIENE